MVADYNARVFHYGNEMFIMYDNDMSDMYRGSGFSIYKGVVVQWDSDGRDTRVLGFIDRLSVWERKNLACVQEHEGCLTLLWKYSVPENFKEGKSVEVPGDVWSIHSSRSLFGRGAGN